MWVSNAHSESSSGGGPCSSQAGDELHKQDCGIRAQGGITLVKDNRDTLIIDVMNQPGLVSILFSFSATKLHEISLLPRELGKAGSQSTISKGILYISGV